MCVYMYIFKRVYKIQIHSLRNNFKVTTCITSSQINRTLTAAQKLPLRSLPNHNQLPHTYPLAVSTFLPFVITVSLFLFIVLPPMYVPKQYIQFTFVVFELYVNRINTFICGCFFHSTWDSSMWLLVTILHS